MAFSIVARGFASSPAAYTCEGLFCTNNNPDWIWQNAGPEDELEQDKTLGECQELCVLDDTDTCVAVVHNAMDKTCQRIKVQPGAPDLPSKNFWTYVPSLGGSVQFQTSELQRLKNHTSGATANQCQAFMLDVDLQEFSEKQGRLIAQWTPDHGDAKQFVQVGPYFGRPAISEVIAAYIPPPPPPMSNASLELAPAPLYLVKQDTYSNGGVVVSSVGLTPTLSAATTFEFSNAGMKNGEECFRLAKTTGMHPMGSDGNANDVSQDPKCSYFPGDVPKGGPSEWKMVVQGKQWCLADPVQVDNKWKLKDAINIGKDGEKDCSDRWQISSDSLGSGLDFKDAGAIGTCELFLQEAASLRTEESSTATCPNMNGMWNIHYPFYPGILDYKAQIQVSGNVGTMTIEEDDLVYHFAIQGECRRIRFCVTPIVMPDDVSCTTVGTFFEGTLDSAGNTITWDDAAYPPWTNAIPLHNKCPNMPYYACATGPLNMVDPQQFPCAFAPDYQKCEEYCKLQPKEECHFCSDGSCIPISQYII